MLMRRSGATPWRNTGSPVGPATTSWARTCSPTAKLARAFWGELGVPRHIAGQGFEHPEDLPQRPFARAGIVPVTVQPGL